MAWHLQQELGLKQESGTGVTEAMLLREGDGLGAGGGGWLRYALRVQAACSGDRLHAECEQSRGHRTPGTWEDGDAANIGDARGKRGFMRD